MSDTMDQHLFNTGVEGVFRMEEFILPLVANGPPNLSESDVRTGCIIHSFALVWNTISGNLPVEIGEPHMEALIDSLAENITDFGFDWSRDDIKVSVGRVWYEIVQVPGETGPEKLFNISRNFLGYYLLEDTINAEVITGMVGVIRAVMGRAQVCLEELEVQV